MDASCSLHRCYNNVIFHFSSRFCPLVRHRNIFVVHKIRDDNFWNFVPSHPIGRRPTTHLAVGTSLGIWMKVR